MIPDSEISKCPEFEVKSKIGNNFKNSNPLEENSVRIYKIIFEVKRQKGLEKKPGCKFLRINTSDAENG